MIVNCFPKSPSVDTIKSKTFTIDSLGEMKTNFLNKLELEVIQQPRQAKKLKKLLMTTHSMCVSMFLLAQPTFAATTELDPDVQKSILILEITCAILAVALAVVGLMAAGVWKMFFGGKQADEWTTNIYKGLGQVIIAPIAVALIVGLATLLFSNLPAFQPIGKALSTWFSN